MQEFQELRRILEEAEDDIAKAMGGNKAAGTRVRKAMQDIKTVARTSYSTQQAHGSRAPKASRRAVKTASTASLCYPGRPTDHRSQPVCLLR